MLSLLKKDDILIASASTQNQSVDNLLAKEWLLTNSRGGYASSTVINCNTRRYHGLLIGALNPPVNRFMALANCLETVIFNDKEIELANFEFNQKIHPQGFSHQTAFRQDTGVHFDYKLDRLEMTKSLYLAPDNDTVALVYHFTRVRDVCDFLIRPFVALRDFHYIQKSDADLYCKSSDSYLVVGYDSSDSPELFIKCQSMKFSQCPQWWYDFVYRIDKQRGQEFNEDLWTPGFFKTTIDSPCKIVLWANLGDSSNSQQIPYKNLRSVQNALSDHRNSVLGSIKTKDLTFKGLCLAADQFICQRKTSEPQQQRYTILAGFPWFADWGRDAFISLPGLLLYTKRFDVAKSVLTTFAHAVDHGMIPNRFDDRSSTAHFNSIDASLWFINAAFQYFYATNDIETFNTHLLGTICSIVDAYQNGTKFNTHADTDGLITAGDENTQLTWMDAKCQGIAFTPRYGKAVEINALWYNALCYLAQFYSQTDTDKAHDYHITADKVQQSFVDLFWNPQIKCLNDCILPNGLADISIRPNQIFAVSMAFSPLSRDMQRAVVQTVAKELLTPLGLRTLNPSNRNYNSRYEGSQYNRDQAYHQGTVWPYLIGHFIEAYLKVNDFSGQSKKEAVQFLEPLLSHFQQQGCLGSVSEIFDADHPQLPKGCFAQAWSVAEVIRAYCLINNIQ